MNKEQVSPAPSAQLTPVMLEAGRAHVREVVEKARTSFYWAMRLLPAEKRDAMYAIYAFCREVDDIADEEAPEAKKLEGLAAWQEEIERLYEGRPSYKTAQALSSAIEAYQLPKEEFLAILDGMATDATEQVVAPNMAELLLYCRRVAGAVGLLSVRVFGDAGKQALELAIVQGEALQLTNILRDLGEDARRGRLYLPREALLAAGIEMDNPKEVLNHPALVEVCRSLASEAEARFSKARSLLRECDRKALKPAVMMLEAYHLLLKRLIAEDWKDPWGEKVSLARSQKLWLLLRHGLFG